VAHRDLVDQLSRHPKADKLEPTRMTQIGPRSGYKG